MRRLLLSIALLGLAGPSLADFPVTRNADSLERLETMRDSLEGIRSRDTLVFQGARSHGIGGPVTSRHRSEQEQAQLDQVTAFSDNGSRWLVELRFSHDYRPHDHRSARHGTAQLMPANYRQGNQEQIALAQQVEQTISSQGHRLSAAYRRALRQIPDLQGSVLLVMELNGDGAVSDIQVSASELKYPSLEQRLSDVLGHIRFKIRDDGSSLPRQYQAANQR